MSRFEDTEQVRSLLDYFRYSILTCLPKQDKFKIDKDQDCTVLERRSQCLLMETQDKLKIQINRSLSLGDVILRKRLHPLQRATYCLAVYSRSSRTETGKVSDGNAIFIGDGMLLTAAHCVQKKSEAVYDQISAYVVQRLSINIDYERLAQGKYWDCKEVEVIGFLDGRMRQDDFLSSDVTIPGHLDLALLKIKGERLPRNDEAALPALASAEKIRAVFVGYNKPVDVDAPLISQYPESVKTKDLRQAIRSLKPGIVSVSTGAGMLMRVSGSGGLSRASTVFSDIICYDISTSAGASGSAIGEEDRSSLIGMHVASYTTEMSGQCRRISTFPRTQNAAINLGTAVFKSFALRAILPMFRDSTLRCKWEKFVALLPDGDPPQNITFNSTFEMRHHPDHTYNHGSTIEGKWVWEVYKSKSVC
ncbi:hypothetical protein BDD12DRAFT_882361 [Trichophaea hybrida]|nr:hypothetical protein BDD12DRAFT_882361 [Trichophaea hybrida]